MGCSELGIGSPNVNRGSGVYGWRAGFVLFSRVWAPGHWRIFPRCVGFVSFFEFRLPRYPAKGSAACLASGSFGFRGL